MKQKLFTFFLALVASVSTIYAQSGTCGNNLTWRLSNGTLTISGTGAMEDYYFYSPWYDYRSSILSVIISDGVTSIGNYAFHECSSLTSVTIPNSVTSIGEMAFSYCSSLTSVTIGNSVTSIGNNAFFVCSSLPSVTIPNSVTSIGQWAFSQCRGLTSVTIPNSVTSIEGAAFMYCTSLTSVTIGNSVTSIGDDAFEGCSNITSVTWNAKNCNSYNFGNQVTSFEFGNEVEVVPSSLCKGMEKLTSITIPNSVTSIGSEAFDGCSSLTSINVDAYNSKYSSADGVLFNKDKTTLIAYPGGKQGAYTIPNSVISIGKEAFRDCSSLTSVTIPNSVTSIGYFAFNSCSSLSSVTIGNSVTSIGIGAFKGCSNITSVTWNAKNCNSYNFGSQVASFEFGNEVEVIPSSLCKGMERLTFVTFPNSVKTIGTSAFEGCVRLGKISLGTGLEEIAANAFAGCTRLYDIYVYATYPPFAEESSFANYNYNVHVYIPCEYQRDYTLDIVWSKFKYIECISSDNVTTDEIVITPSENEANVIWPSVNGAASYELVIKDKDGNIVCTLIFNANGQLTSIAFNAPSRNGVPAQTQSAGFSFTVTGLDSGTGYYLTLTAKDNSGNAIQTETISFVTSGGNISTDMDQVQSNEIQSTKVIKDGQVLILRNGKTYTMQGQEVK